jgi:hypothetical protein
MAAASKTLSRSSTEPRPIRIASISAEATLPTSGVQRPHLRYVEFSEVTRGKPVFA